MNKIFQILIVFLCFSSCSKPKHRVIYNYDIDTLIHREAYELIIESEDSIAKYEYKCITQDKKSFILQFNQNSKTLTFNTMQFKIAEKHKFSTTKIPISNFDLYTPKAPEEDAYRDVLFNSDYGVLYIDLGEGEKSFFLNTEDLQELRKDILKQLQE